MPKRPRRRCPSPGCSKPQPCPDHHRKTERRSKYADLYESREWRELAATVLDEERACPGWPEDHPIACRQRTTQVDHVIALEDGGPPLDRTNLRALCASCHGRKSAAERKARARAAGPPG